MKGATKLSSPVSADIGVSIHAPVKGATEWLKNLFGVDYVSIHAPVKGATKVVFFW